MTDHPQSETFEDGVARMTMNQPEARNALSRPDEARRSREAVRRHAADPKPRVVVPRPARAAPFCAGGDVKGFAADAAAARTSARAEGRASAAAWPGPLPAWKWSK